MLRLPGRPWVLFWCVWAAGIVAVWGVAKVAGSSSHWAEGAFGALAVLTGALVILDWQGVASYLVGRRPASRRSWRGWMTEDRTRRRRAA
ncbi:MAG TPA: hypothetical protein VGL20_14060 [Candidatus Dormibacteraeota bacterium]